MFLFNRAGFGIHNASYSVFQFVMAVDAVYARNTLQFIALTYVIRSSVSI
jgi:hypothetical protein